MRPARAAAAAALAVAALALGLDAQQPASRGVPPRATRSPEPPHSAPPAARQDVFEATIPDLQAAMARGELTAVALVDAYLARIAAYDGDGPALNSLIRVNPRARQLAAELDAERHARGPRGPLHGIPVILKDNFDTEDLPTTAGSIALAAYLPPADAFVVQRLRQAGAIVLGKANLHELAAGITTISSLGGQTRNPYDPRRCPGGSSGGTAAAVAANFAAIGWGTDTCGSIRIPAAFTSLFGLRPTQGLVSRRGIVPLSHTQDIAGPLARTATDLAIALDATVGPDPDDSVTQRLGSGPVPRFVEALDRQALRGARLGLLRNYLGPGETDSEIAAVIRAALDSMAAHGATVLEIEIPHLDQWLAGSRAVDFETKFDLMDYLARDSRAPVRSLGEILATGLYHASLESRFRRVDTVSARQSAAYTAALAKQAELRDRLTGLLDSLALDALVYPTMRQPPALIGDPQPGSTCQLSANSGLPALSLPAGFTGDGLPVGLELLGRAYADPRLVSLAYAFEQTGPRRRPPLATPPLVAGRAPGPVAFRARGAGPGGAPAVAAEFRLDQLRFELGYRVRVTGLAAEDILAVSLQRAGRPAAGGGPGPVVYRLSGPGAAQASGTLALSAGELARLREGRYALVLFTTGHPAGAVRLPLVVPR